MAKSFIKHIADEFKSYSKRLLLVKNPDAFLKREAVKAALSKHDIRVFDQGGISLRVDFELQFKKNPQHTIYFITSFDGILEDIRQEAVCIEFRLSDYFTEFNSSAILGGDLKMLEVLFDNKPLTSLNKAATEQYIEKLFSNKLERIDFDFQGFKDRLDALLGENKINWLAIIKLISSGLLQTIGLEQSKRVLDEINRVNAFFQTNLINSFKQSINSSPIKKPRIVSKIQDHLLHHYKNEKVALVVIDGMAYWQYLLLREYLDSKFQMTEDVIYSWIPSITQLSRQAIFRGDRPDGFYIQNPNNEERLWFDYWEKNGLDKYQIRYNHGHIDISGLERVTKFGMVYKDLDDKMHSSSDYADLKGLTKNWFKKSKIVKTLKTIADLGFTIYLTTDHGNIPAKGWRNLKGKEKLGTNKSGSRSARHLEYSEQWIADDFLNNNPDLKGVLVQDANVIYLTNNLSFSSKKELVTHGGSHILEVLIPFIKLTNG